MFESLSNKLSGAFSALRSRGKITESDLTAAISDIRQALLEADVALEVVEEFTAVIHQKSLELLSTLQPGTNQAQAIYEVVNAELIQILGGATRRIRFAKNPPTIIMLAGLQGAGKTTLAAKLAKFYKEEGETPLLIAADLQRPNAVSQLQVVGQAVGVPVFAPAAGNGVGDPVAVARDGIKFATTKLHSMVIVDTAGRLGVDQELMAQAIAIRDAISPQEILFVVDAMIGQDAVKTAKAFADGVGFDGVVLTKLDGDARGGAALSIAQLTGRPIMFASTGEKFSDFDIFYPDRMASRILGMGDVATLAEQAKKAFAGDTAKKLEDKFAAGEDFTLEDFLDQLEAISKMGSMGKLLGMLPGSAGMKKQIENFDESEITRTKAIVQSMTPHERRDLKILNGGRRARIALGSGRKVSEVNALVDKFTAAAKMMKQMRNGGQMPASQNFPGQNFSGQNFPGLGAPPTAKKAPAPQKKRSKSGNPAKRAQEGG